jgi:soluble lytic murein transglycosylase
VLKRVVLWAAGFAVVFGCVAAYALQAEPGWYVRLRYPLRYEAIIRGHARNYHLDPALVASVVYAESKFRAGTVSKAGAVGLMQLLPATAEGIAERTGGSKFTTADLVDPEINVRYGCWYLRHLLNKYRGHPDSLELALAAYNAGQANVDRWIADTPKGQPVQIPFPETRAYISRILHLRTLYRRGYGLR